MKITVHSSRQILHSIRIGDSVEDGHGNSGRVTAIETIRKHLSVHYYFRINKAKTILIIK